MRLVPLKGQWGLRPNVDGRAWHIAPVEHGRPASDALLTHLARLREAEPERLRAEASALGAFGPPGARPRAIAGVQPDWRSASFRPVASGFDVARAEELLVQLRLRLNEPPRQLTSSTLVDPDALARARFVEGQAEGIIELARDGGASRASRTRWSDT